MIHATIPPVCERSRGIAASRQDILIKPKGSLGRLEELAIQLAAIQGVERPRADRGAVFVMSGDHGVVAEGVSPCPQVVTRQQTLNFASGRGAIAVLSRHVGSRLVVTDIGVAGPGLSHPNLLSRRIAPGTANMAHGPAMTREQAVAALRTGVEIVEAECDKGLDLAATGEMGIGNTTPASAIISAYSGLDPEAVTGCGAGLDEAGRLRKAAVIRRALEVNRPDVSDPIDVLAKVGGFEIAGLAGVILGAASRRVAVVVDGFISTSAALIAAEIDPAVKPYLIASHNSVERGHAFMMKRLGLRPLLDLDMRLGEGTGSMLAFQVIRSAVCAHNEMTTFAESDVTENP